MTEEELEKLSDLIRKHDDDVNNTTDVWKWVVMMAVGGALILFSIVIGLIACSIGRCSATVKCCYLLMIIILL